jgi:hypothetical protein
VSFHTDHSTSTQQPPTVWHDKGELTILKSSKGDDGKWQNTYTPILEPFAMDIGCIQSAWQEYKSGVGRVLTMFDPRRAAPDRPSDKAEGVLVVPVASVELQGRADWIIKYKGTLSGFNRLYDALEASDEAAQGLIPMVQYTVGGDVDQEPQFTVVQWTPRPFLFGKRILPVPAAPVAPVAVVEPVTPAAADLLTKLRERRDNR